MRALERQLAPQDRDRLRARSIVLRALCNCHENTAALDSELLGHAQPDPGAGVRAGGAESLSRPRIPRKLTDQDEQILEPYPGLRVLVGVLGQALHDVHGLGEPPAGVDQKGKEAANLLVGHRYPQLATGDLHMAGSVQADQQTARLRSEKCADEPRRPHDIEHAVKRLVSNLHLARPRGLVLLATDLHAGETRRPRKGDRDPGAEVLGGSTRPRTAPPALPRAPRASCATNGSRPPRPGASRATRLLFASPSGGSCCIDGGGPRERSRPSSPRRKGSFPTCRALPQTSRTTGSSRISSCCGEEVADGGHEPAIGVHAEGNFEARAAVARRVRRIEIAESGARRVERHDDLGVAGRCRLPCERRRPRPRRSAARPPSARETSQIRSLKRLSGSPSAQVGTSCLFHSSGEVGNRVPRGHDDRMLGLARLRIVGDEGVVVDDEVQGVHPIAGEAGGAIGHRLEGLPGPDPAPLETLLEPGKESGQERRASHQQHIVHTAHLHAPLLQDLLHRDGSGCDRNPARPGSPAGGRG